MKEIAIISASVRMGRLSHRVALYFKRYLECNNLANAEILDLNEYNSRFLMKGITSLLRYQLYRTAASEVPRYLLLCSFHSGK